MPHKSGYTESFDRVLVLWLDLQRMIAEVKEEGSGSPVVPWNCQDERVAELWEQITRPENLLSLMEWLYQSAAGEPEIWAHQALQECQLRSEKAS